MVVEGGLEVESGWTGMMGGGEKRRERGRGRGDKKKGKRVVVVVAEVLEVVVEVVVVDSGRSGCDDGGGLKLKLRKGGK